MAMSIQYAHVRLLCDKYAECYRFYRDVLGMTPRFGEGENGVYEEFETGNGVVALFKRDLMAKVVGATAKPKRADAQDAVCLTFSVEDVDIAVETLEEEAGVKFVTRPHDEPSWMIRVAHFRDPDGNLIEMNSPIH